MVSFPQVPPPKHFTRLSSPHTHNTAMTLIVIVIIIIIKINKLVEK